MPKSVSKFNIPSLRFPGFSGAWEGKRLKEIGKFRSGQGFTNSEQGGDKGVPFYKVSDMNNVGNEKVMMTANHYVSDEQIARLKYKVIKEKSIIFAKVGAAIFLERKRVAGKFLIDNNMMAFTPYKNIDFIKCIFDRIRLSRFAQIGALPSYNASDLSIIRVHLPSTDGEQQKISNFLGAVDSWIENLRLQKEAFDAYKKGMMQKLFSREIRFKDAAGKDFPEWEERRLGEVGKSYNGLSGKSGDDFGKGKPFVTYKQIFDSSEIDVSKFSYVTVGNNEKQNKVKFGDVLFTASSETPEEVGFSSVHLDKESSPYLNSFSFGFRFDSLEDFNPYFAKFFFRSFVYRREVIRLAQGSTRYNILRAEFMDMSFSFPGLKEQGRIADFLTSVDKVIESKQQQITKAEQWKKGLMQGLFV